MFTFLRWLWEAVKKDYNLYIQFSRVASSFFVIALFLLTSLSEGRGPSAKKAQIGKVSYAEKKKDY